MAQAETHTDRSAPREPHPTHEAITPARRSYRWLVAVMILAPLAVAAIAFAVRAWRASLG